MRARRTSSTMCRLVFRATAQALAGLGLLACCTLLVNAGPEIPGAPQAHPIGLVGATLHPVSGPDLLSATLLFSEGKIVALGSDVALPADAERIDASGLHLYPGLIESASDLGLVEIPSVRATRDATETGPLNPNVRAQRAFNPDSEMIPVARANGVLTALVAPRGDGVNGVSSLMLLDGWSWEDMTLQADVALHIHWPRVEPVTNRVAPLPMAIAELSERAQWIRRLREALAQSRAYGAAWLAHRSGQGTPPLFDARLESLAPAALGQRAVVIEADELRQIQEVVEFAVAEGLKLILQGGYDAPECAELLRQHAVPVVVAGVHRLPERTDDPYDTPFTVPARLHASRIPFCIAGAVEASQVRNLPYQAATAAANGLPPDVALRSITLSAAEILGVADRLGSLEVGKDATLILTTGDPLETSTQLVRAFIQGRAVDLSNRHTRLYEKYREKLRRDQTRRNEP